VTVSKIGVGLRSAHYPHLVTRPDTRVDWFEALSENYMDSEGRPIHVLETVRADYPVALHGVSLSIASRYSDAEPVNSRYLARLKALIDRVDPFLVSDHLCWTGTGPTNLHDLLPVPFTRESLEWVVEQADRVQNTLGRQIALENVSSYLTYKRSTYHEWEFLVQVARRSGAKILFDVNNIFVSAHNHGFDACEYVDAVPADLVGQIHLAGHTDMGTHLFDTHSCPVCDEVWQLFRRTIARMPGVPVLIEWDEDIPSFDVLEAEAVKAREVCIQEADAAEVAAREAGNVLGPGSGVSAPIASRS